MKRIVLGLGVLAFSAAIIAGTTGAYFTDSKTTGENKFHAGTLSIDLAQDMNASLPFIVNNWAPGETATVQFDVINSGSLPVHLRTYSSGNWDFAGNPGYVKVQKIEKFNDTNSTWSPISSNNAGINGIVYYSPSGTENDLVTVNPGEKIHFRHVVLFDPAAGNEYQGRNFTSKITVDAKQVTPGATWPDSTSVTISCPTDARVQIARAESGVVITWPTSAIGYFLETASSLSGPWTKVATQPSVVGDCFVVTEAANQSSAFYRITQAASSGIPVITVTSPSANSTVAAGSVQTITWSSQNLPGTTDIAIQLKNLATGIYSNQFTGIKNTGSVQWTVPSTLAPGQYMIAINNCLSTNTTPCVSYNGPTITVTSSTPAPNPGVPSISITSPAAGASIARGTTQNITWTSSNIPAGDKIIIQLKSVASGNFLSQTPVPAANTGSFSWTVPATLTAGSYEVHINNCISGNTSSCVTVKGPTIQITASGAAITVQEPVAGTTVAKGGRITVKWQTTNLPGTESLTISLKNATTNQVIAKVEGVPASFGTSGVGVTVPASATSGSYQVLVSNCTTANAQSCITTASNIVTVN